MLSAATVERKRARSCVVQRERGPVGVPAEVASDCFSVSDSEPLVLASSVMAGALHSSQDDPARVVLVRLTSEEVRAECVS